VALLSALVGDTDTGIDRDDPAGITVDDVMMSYDELLAHASGLVGHIQGARAVAVCADAHMDTLLGVVAGLLAGVPVVPIAHDAGPSERGHILRDSAAEMVLGAHDWDEVDLPTIDVHGPPASSVQANGAPGRLIMYTSGTTGAPKGVVLPDTALAACLDGLADAWQWAPDDHLVHGLPLFHVHGLVLGMLGGLRRGCRITHTGRPHPDRYAAAAARGGSLFFGVPTVWGRIVAEPTIARSLSGARAIVSGSAALPVSTFAALTDLTGVTPLERYGMTETLITLSTRIDGERRPGHVGWPLAGVETRLRSDDGTEAAHDATTIGTLEIRGATVGDGYLNRDDATAAATTADGWFITGDSATIGPDGMHRIVGRTSVDIIKSGGYKVGAGEVEAAVAEVPGVHEVAVVGMPDADLGERIVAFVVGDGVDEAGVIAHVAATLSVHKRPREVRRVDSLPRNALGKVQKAQLRGS